MINKLKDTSIVELTYSLLIEGVNRRASDILIEPLEDELQIRVRIDGVLSKFVSLPFEMYSKIVTRIKVMAGLDISEKRLPQDGSFKIKFPGKEVDFRVSVIPSRLGERVVLRVLDKGKLILDINKLGVDSYSLNSLKQGLVKPYGIILICGPTGSGKTTTLYASIKYIDSIEKNIVTVEDPVEYQLYGINQVQVREEIGLTFPAVLRSILRQDPDIILVGEIRDSETAEIAVRAALTGHLVLSTLHTTTSTGGIIRLVNMGIEPYLVSSSCLLIVSQNLIRLLCTECKEPHPLPKVIALQLEQYGYPKESFPQVIYKSKGCKKCNNTGYFRRRAIMETLVLSREIKTLIEKNAPEREIRKKARMQGMKSLRERGYELLIEGLTSLEEVVRVTTAQEG